MAGHTFISIDDQCSCRILVEGKVTVAAAHAKLLLEEDGGGNVTSTRALPSKAFSAGATCSRTAERSRASNGPATSPQFVSCSSLPRLCTTAAMCAVANRASSCSLNCANKLLS